jgi:hypothetical protein
MTIYSVRIVIENINIKKRENYIFDRNDIDLNEFRVILIIIFGCSLAAILAGACGIAGGMIIGPIFLKFGMLP